MSLNLAYFKQAEVLLCIFCDVMRRLYLCEPLVLFVSLLCTIYKPGNVLDEKHCKKYKVQIKKRVKVSRNKPKRLRGVPEGQGSRIFSAFGTMNMVRSSPLRTGRLHPQEYTGTHFQRLSRPQGKWNCRSSRKKSSVKPPGIDPGTYRLIAQRLNHYATPIKSRRSLKFVIKKYVTFLRLLSRQVSACCISRTRSSSIGRKRT